MARPERSPGVHPGEGWRWVGPDRRAVGSRTQTEALATEKNARDVREVGLAPDKGAQDAAGRARAEAAVAEADTIEVDGIPRILGAVEQTLDIVGPWQVNELIEVQYQSPGVGPARALQTSEGHVDALPPPGVVDECDEGMRSSGEGEHSLPQGRGIVIVAGEVNVVETNGAVIGEPFRGVGDFPSGGRDQRDEA